MMNRKMMVIFMILRSFLVILRTNEKTKMPRAKLKMKLIENPKKSKATYKNRRDGLVQKVSQLATLCGVEAFLICFDPKAAGPVQDGGAVTTWPADREQVLKLVGKYRKTPADKFNKILDTHTFYQEDLEKQQRQLLKVQQCGAGKLDPWDRSLDDLSAADLSALMDTLDETLQRVQLRIDALGGHLHNDVVPSSTATVTVAAPQALPLPDNAFDFAFSLPDAGSIVTQYYYSPYDMLPQPVPLQPPCFGFQMPPPYLGYQMPPPTLVAAPDFSTTGTGIMDFLPYATNGANGVDATAWFNDDLVPGFAACGAYVDDDVLGQPFAAGPAGAGYDLAHHMTARVWPMSRLDNPNPMDGAAFQLRNDFAGLPGSSSSSSFQGGFPK